MPGPKALLLSPYEDGRQRRQQGNDETRLRLPLSINFVERLVRIGAAGDLGRHLKTSNRQQMSSNCECAVTTLVLIDELPLEEYTGVLTDWHPDSMLL